MKRLILSIDTATPLGGICLAEDGRVLGIRTNPNQFDHASWIHVAIKDLMKTTGTTLSQLAAIAVTEGPGSYTGLRVGLTTAKGLCYALQIPLIGESTLKVMAYGVKEDPRLKETYFREQEETVFIAPMIDARRMEVFTAVFSPTLETVFAPAAMVLEPDSFSGLLQKGRVVFAGNGSPKWQGICRHSHALFADTPLRVADLAALADQQFGRNTFKDLVYSEPAYLKNVYVVPANPRG